MLTYRPPARRGARVLGLLSSLALLASAGRGSADDVLLAGGTHLEGVVLERGPERVRVLLPAGGELTLAAADVREIVPDEGAPKGDKVVRYTSGAKAAGSKAAGSKAVGSKAAHEGLEVALLHLVHPTTGRRVDLLGAVHIADMAFFREVQRVLEDADVVLYELVKPRDADPEAEPEGPNPLRDFQKKLARWFGFAFQLDGISYDRPHFVHADMTMEEFSAAAQGLGKKPAPAADTPEAGAPEAGTPAPAPSAGQPEPSEPATPPRSGLPGVLGGPGALAGLEAQIGMIEVLLKGLGIDDPTRGPQVRRSVKMVLGRMLGALGTKIGLLLGADVSELLITKRNEVVVARLAEVPASAKTIAIFYGAAHLPDLEQRLLALGYERVGARWLLAWDMSEKAAAQPAVR